MDKTIDVTVFQNTLEHVLEEVISARTNYIVTRDSRPVVVLMTYDDYVKLVSREEVLARFNQAWAEIGERNAHYSEEEVEADLEAATRELREKRRGLE